MHRHQGKPKHRILRMIAPACGSIVLACAALLFSPAQPGSARMLIHDSLEPASPASYTLHSSTAPAATQQSVARPEPSSRGGARSANPDISTPEKFIAVVAEAARDSQQTTRVPASVTIAQAILESEWGRSKLATAAFNFFGIKAQRGPGPAGVIKMDTWEVLGGVSTTVVDAFRAYHNIFESVDDHAHFLSDNPRYAPAFKVTSDAREFARRIHAAGYATDPNYSTKLIKLMDKYNLYQYDLPNS